MSNRFTPMIWFVILTLFAVCLALGLPPDPHTLQQYHTSLLAYHIAITAVLIPYILIWYTAFYAFAKLQEYSRPLREDKDGAAIHKITLGMGTLAFSLIVPTIISLLLNSIAVHYPALKAPAVIIQNYLGLYPGLVAFLLLYNGAHQLACLIRDRTQTVDLRWHAPWFLLLGVVFSHLTIKNHYQSHPYHLNLILLITTYIVPYLYGWMIGLLSAYELRVYAKTVKGLLYRVAIRRLADGITLAITGSIAFQFVSITIAQRLHHSLVATLLIEYGLLAIIAVGLIYMAIGAKKLKLIEEI